MQRATTGAKAGKYPPHTLLPKTYGYTDGSDPHHLIFVVMSLTRLPALCSAIRSLQIVFPVPMSRSAACLHTSKVSFRPDKPRDRRDLTRNLPREVEGTDGQDALEIDVAKERTK